MSNCIFNHCALLCLALLSLPAAAQDKLEPRLRQLEKEIAAVRGLEFKAPVLAKVIPRPATAATRAQGHYSTSDKRLYLYDDISGAYEQGVLIHEMVHALQDQHFGLKKLHQTTFGSEAELALAALIEGDATFTMIELLKKEQPKVEKMLEAPLAKAKDLRGNFLYAQGARYVKALKERGGWPAVNAAYRFPPRTTAAILHPEGVKTIDLGPGTTRGEFGLIQHLASQPETAPLAVAAAAGWKGDRLIEKGEQRSWVIAFGSKEQAQRCQEALVKLQALQTVKGKRGVLLRGERVLLLEAPDDAAYAALLERAEGPPALHIHATRDKQAISFGTLIDRLLEGDLICIGETHDSELHHRVQLQLIKALYAHDERLGVGMEMFQRPFQSAIDRYSRGESSEEEFLKAAEYDKRWGFDWSLYRPIVDFSKRNGVALAALNVPRELTGRLSKVGFAALNPEEKTQLGTIDFQVQDHRAYWYERLAKMHGDAKRTDEQKERSYQVMTAWDGYMAASAAAFQRERKLRRLVILAGSGHIDRGFGIPQRAAKLTGGRALTVHIAVGATIEKATAEPVADFIVVVQ